MKIILISANTAETPYPVYPLGMGIVANALARAGHEVVQFDFLHSGQSLEKLADALRSQMPALAGISIRNIDNVNLVSEQHYINTVRQIVMAIRSVIKAPIVLVVPVFNYAGSDPDAVGADHGIAGEAESTVVDFVAY